MALELAELASGEKRVVWPRGLAKRNEEVTMKVPVVATSLEAHCSSNAMAKSGVVASALSWCQHGGEKEQNRGMDWAIGCNHKARGLGTGTNGCRTMESMMASSGAMGGCSGDMPDGDDEQK